MNVVPASDKFIAKPQVAAGERHTISLKADGTVWSWGFNDKGQLGIGETGAEKVTPVQVMRPEIGDEDGNGIADTDFVTLANIVAVAAGGDHNLALCNDGSVYAWGANNYGQLGLGSTEKAAVSSATKVVGPEFNANDLTVLGARLGDGGASGKIVAIAAGGHRSNSYSYSLALDERGTVYGFGYNNDGVILPSGNTYSVPQNISG